MSGAVQARDERMMRRALREASRGEGRTHPNPSVGAVVFRGDRVLGSGFTKPPGGAHAEVAAIENVRRRHGDRVLRGASIAVTLEPCSFQGRTGPCTEAIVSAGLTRVVAGCRDPHPRVAGNGFRKLRRRGLEVITGVLEDECRHQHRGFISVCERRRPWVTLKLATTLDGRIATASGESRWITGPPAREFVHRLRDRNDAVMVGSETAIADDPALTVRRDGRVVREPIRVLLDGRLRVPATARMLSGSAAGGTWVLCRARAAGIRALREKVGRVLPLPVDGGGHIALDAAFKALADEGLTRVLVEGGGTLAAALLRADLVDEVHWMLAPVLIGGDGKPGLGPLGLARLAEAVALESVDVRRRGVGSSRPRNRSPRRRSRRTSPLRSKGNGESQQGKSQTIMKVATPSVDATGLRVALVVSRFNHLISIRLIDGAREALLEHGADPEDLELFWVAGAFEIPQAARLVAESGRFDAIVTLGSVIRGGTPHFEYVCRGVTDGVREIMRTSRVPVGFGVLTTDDIDQALARAGGSDGNKGGEVALAAVEMARLMVGLGDPAAGRSGLKRA